MTKRTRRRVKAGAFTRKVCTNEPYGVESVPLWSLPRTAAAYDAMVEQMALAICLNAGFGRQASAANAALRAIGITRPKD